MTELMSLVLTNRRLIWLVVVTNGSGSEGWVGRDMDVEAGIGSGVRYGVAHTVALGLNSDRWGKGDHGLLSVRRSDVMTVFLT